MRSPASPSVPRLPLAPVLGPVFLFSFWAPLSAAPWCLAREGWGGWRGVDGEGWVSRHATWGGSRLPSQWLLVQREGTGDKAGTLVDVVKKRDLPKVSERLQQKDERERTGRLTGGYAGAVSSWGGTRRGRRRDRGTAGRRQPVSAEHLLCAGRPSRAPPGEPAHFTRTPGPSEDPHADSGPSGLEVPGLGGAAVLRRPRQTPAGK